MIGIGIAMIGGDSDGDNGGDEAGSSPSAAQSADPTSPPPSRPRTTARCTVDAKALRLEGGTSTASDVKGAKADGGVYVQGFNAPGRRDLERGRSATGKYTLHTGYGVPVSTPRPPSPSTARPRPPPCP